MLSMIPFSWLPTSCRTVPSILVYLAGDFFDTRSTLRPHMEIELTGVDTGEKVLTEPRHQAQ